MGQAHLAMCRSGQSFIAAHAKIHQKESGILNIEMIDHLYVFFDHE